MKAHVSIFQLPKAGHTKAEYEDSCWPRESCAETLPTRLAVADGATDAVYSGLWAGLLVEAWGLSRFGDVSPEAIRETAESWQQMIQYRSMPWYVEEKAKRGTYAAFVGLDLNHETDSGSGGWTAAACGDCCLFQIRCNKVITKFPVTHSEDFSSSPLLLGTHTMNVNDQEGIRKEAGQWEVGDSFYLMSDALACWFLAKYESGFEPSHLLGHLITDREPSFEMWIDDLRERRELKNDDCTLLSVTLE